MLRFVDVSNNNKDVDFAKVKAEGAVGVYLKVTEGLSFVDPDYVANRKAAKAAGLKVGGYHFGHPKNDPAKELAFFLAHLVIEPGDLLPVLDLEVTDDSIATKVKSFGISFLEGLHARFGYSVIYSGQYFMEEHGLTKAADRRWIADYGARPSSFDAWQYTDGQVKYGAPIAGLDTSFVVSLPLLVYKAPAVKRVPAVVKKHVVHSAYFIRHGLLVRRGSQLFRFLKRNRFRLIGR